VYVHSQEVTSVPYYWSGFFSLPFSGMRLKMFEEQQRFKCEFKDIIKYFKYLFKYLNIGWNLNNLFIINNYMYLVTD
jgi:hypothetical protein